MYCSVMSALPAQGLRRAGPAVVVLVSAVVVVIVGVGTTAGLTSLTLLSSSGLTVHWKRNNRDHLTL